MTEGKAMDFGDELNEALGMQTSYFPDLTPYQYGDDQHCPRVLRIGWLGDGAFAKKETENSEAVKKIGAIKASIWPSIFHFNLVRGPISCQLCPKGNRAAFNTELLVQDSENSESYFGCPAMIDHLIQEHGYSPPDQFVRSVMALRLDQPFDAVVAFDEACLSTAAMRKLYEIRAKHLARAQDKPENTRYRRWLESRGFWPIK